MASSTSTDRPRPKTQAERRAETRSALLNATIESLVTYGYTGTTTVRIAELAGVSRGAQTPYFRSRADLLAAAVSHLAEIRAEALHQKFSGKEVSIEEALDAIWEEHQGPIFDAALELWVASRTDPELRSRMVEVERGVALAVNREAGAALGEAARKPGFADDLIFAHSTIRGLAMLQVSHGVSNKALNERWLQTRERLVRILS